jgi:putative transposase
MYRVMKEEKQLNYRGRRQKPKKKEPTTHTATGPNQVWMWDISWLRGPILGQFFYLYLVLDLFSRKIVAWEIYETESGENATELIQKAVWREKAAGKPIVLHADNGSPMKASTFLETLRSLGLSASYSRPRVSNDNAYVERLFGTAKYRPDYPSAGFQTLEDAKEWILRFVRWYNAEHQHSGIGYVTPEQRHQGDAEAILSHRSAVYEAARKAHPERWSKDIRNWGTVEQVTLNPTKRKVA